MGIQLSSQFAEDAFINSPGGLLRALNGDVNVSIRRL